jgi:uracil-DNA glycosylase
MMEKCTREQNIKRIINMEDRVVKCNRCPSLTRCSRRPSLGKGDLEPQLLMVFEYDNQFTTNKDEIIRLRDMIKKHLMTERVYYTFMARCQPKACAIRQNVNCYMSNKLIDKDYSCLLSNLHCEGIPVKPSVDTLMNCLPFLMEEIEILHPDHVVLFGNRVGDYVQKSCGIFEKAEVNNAFQYEGSHYMISVEETHFTVDSAIALSALI